MMHRNYIITIAALLLLAFLVWKEIKRPGGARLYWRLLASVLAVVSLVYLLLPFPFSREAARPGGKKCSCSKRDTLPVNIQSVYWQRQINAGADLHLQGMLSEQRCNTGKAPAQRL